MFSTEMKFAADCITHWFSKKIKSQHLEVNLLKKLQFEKDNPIEWENGKCVICNFPLEINTKGIDTTAKEMSYLDFANRKEHNFLRNILNKFNLKESPALESLNSYYDVFVKFVKISILLENSFGVLSDFDQIAHKDL